MYNVANPPENVTYPHAVTLDMRRVMEVFVSQLRLLIGVNPQVCHHWQCCVTNLGSIILLLLLLFPIPPPPPQFAIFPIFHIPPPVFASFPIFSYPPPPPFSPSFLAFSYFSHSLSVFLLFPIPPQFASIFT